MNKAPNQKFTSPMERRSIALPTVMCRDLDRVAAKLSIEKGKKVNALDVLRLILDEAKESGSSQTMQVVKGWRKDNGNRNI